MRTWAVALCTPQCRTWGHTNAPSYTPGTVRDYTHRYCTLYEGMGWGPSGLPLIWHGRAAALHLRAQHDPGNPLKTLPTSTRGVVHVTGVHWVKVGSLWTHSSRRETRCQNRRNRQKMTKKSLPPTPSFPQPRSITVSKSLPNCRKQGCG